MLFATLLVLVIIYCKEIIGAAGFVLRIFRPFLYGGMVAFIINILMNFIENNVMSGWKGKKAARLKRPVSLFISILLIVLIISVVVGMVIPQIASSAAEIGRKMPAFVERVRNEAVNLSENNPALAEQIENLQIPEIKWDDVISSITGFLKNGAGNLLSSTVSVVGNIISGVVDAIIALVFAVYILAQKEKLSSQVKRVMSAYLPKKANSQALRVFSLLYTNFSNFITGQCLEAVILGSMFVISMTILRLPYALVIGILISLTALIPIVGAFIGCAVGVFLILIDDPVKALVFIVLFIILQQIEGKLIYPKVVGNFVGLPGIWVLVAITVGGSLFGVIGMLVFIPLMSTAYTLLREDVNRRNAIKKS
jgi:predicted PurR-regulated permease PerM